MTSSELARRAGVTLRTVRFYEEKGILTPAAVSAGGKRLYDAEALAALGRARLLKEAGMSVDEIVSTLQTLSTKKTRNKARQQAHAALLAAARARIAGRIRELGRLQQALDRALENEESCGACGAPDCRACPALDTWARFGLENPSKEEST